MIKELTSWDRNIKILVVLPIRKFFLNDNQQLSRYTFFITQTPEVQL